MDSPIIGTQCKQKGCSIVDFLPTKCPICQDLYCANHYLQAAHDCISVATVLVDDISTTDAERPHASPCAFEGCQKLSLESHVAKETSDNDRVPAVCACCSLSFCALHRFPSDHSCKKAAAPRTPRNEVAKALRVKYFPLQNAAKSKELPPTFVGSSLKKAKKSQGAKLVQLMKMRQSAIAGDSSTAPNHVLSDRIHIQVKLDSSDTYRTFWFPKSISLGRTFDLLRQHLKASSLKSYTLFEEFEDSSEPPVPLISFDRPLSEEVEDGCRIVLKSSV